MARFTVQKTIESNGELTRVTLQDTNDSKEAIRMATLVGGRVLDTESGQTWTIGSQLFIDQYANVSIPELDVRGIVSALVEAAREAQP